MAFAEPRTPTSLFWNRKHKVDGNHRDPVKYDVQIRTVIWSLAKRPCDQNIIHHVENGLNLLSAITLHCPHT